MNEHLKIILVRLSNLLRTRIIMSCIGLWVLNNQPASGQWVAIIVGLALGVSAIEAAKEVKKNE